MPNRAGRESLLIAVFDVRTAQGAERGRLWRAGEGAGPDTLDDRGCGGPRSGHVPTNRSPGFGGHRPVGDVQGGVVIELPLLLVKHLAYGPYGLVRALMNLSAKGSEG